MKQIKYFTGIIILLVSCSGQISNDNHYNISYHIGKIPDLSAIGFFGGMGIEMKLFQNYFQSSYYLYIDDVKPYKYKLSDKDFTHELFLKSKFQSLILNEQPKFKSGQQITGYLTF